ncbi:MAG TPA: dihydrofolate reductase family protein [Candidatus Limnocylindrales bacterium]|jgi:dihydrofolate reductase|nr:dihydrofolate reductase family protein [Candidatus Limnocylindrales bacterium]
MLRSTTFLTLDGVMQAPGGPGEDEEGGFSKGGWSVNFFDDEVGEAMDTFMSVPFDLVLGRKTYDIFAAYWPNASPEDAAKPLNAATKYVASRGRPNLSWERSVLLEGDVAQAVAGLKQEDGPELQVHGSGDLLQTLIREGVVDEFQLLVFPVLVGSGKRLFAQGTVPASLKLIESRVSPSGVFIGRYQPAGELVTGTFGA